MRHSITKSNSPKSAPKRLLQAVIVAAVWLAVWQGIYLLLDNRLLMVSPAAVVARLWELGGTGAFWETVGVSFGRILIGYGSGVALGLLLGAGGALFPFLDRLLSPAMAVIRATPVSSFVILALVWIKSYNLSIFVSFLMVFPMLYAAMRNGIWAADPALLEVAAVYRFSVLKKLRLCYLPAIKPLLTVALTNAIGFAWKAGVAGEVLAQPKIGIGSSLYDAKIYLETLDVFCWTAVTILLSILVEKLVVRLFRGKVVRKGGEPT